MASRRLSAVPPTPSSAWKWPAAWMRSAWAVVRNSRAMFGRPSFSAASANEVYFWNAWLSPANASLRLSWVFGMDAPFVWRAGPRSTDQPASRQPSAMDSNFDSSSSARLVSTQGAVVPTTAAATRAPASCVAVL
jgi:hypothetical protein